MPALPTRLPLVITALSIGACGTASPPHGGTPSEPPQTLSFISDKPADLDALIGRPDPSAPREVPVAGVVSLAVGGQHACVVREDGRVLCWGNGDTYRLGTGRRESSKTPLVVPSVDHAVKVAAGGTMSCAVKDDGAVACWGGYRQTPGDEDGFAWPQVRLPVTVSTPPTWIVEVDVGWTQAVLRDAGGGVSILDAYAGPVPLPKFDRALGLAALGDGFCALTAAGGVQCVTSSEGGAGGDAGGDDGYGEDPGRVLAPLVVDDALRASLHDAEGNDDWAPCGTWEGHDKAPPYCANKMSEVVQVDAQDELACAVRRDGTLACWGCADCWESEHRTDLGFPIEARIVPTPVANVKDVAEVAVGYRHLCTLHKDGAVRCWGDNSQGQLGTTLRGPSSTPVEVLGLGEVVQLDAGLATTCALRKDRTAICWGHPLGTPLEWPSRDEDTASVVPPDHPAVRDVPVDEGKPAPRPELVCADVDVLGADGELWETRYGYDAEGRVVRERSLQWVDGQAKLVDDITYVRDRRGGITSAKHVEQREDGPYTRSVRYRRDKAQRIVWTKANGSVDDSAYTFKWDDAGRLVEGRATDGSLARLGWHERPAPPPFEGLTLSETDDDEDERFGLDTLTVRLVKDAAGRVVYAREIGDDGAATDTTTTWDAAGRIAVERHDDYQIPFFEEPVASEEVHYSYDAAGRLTTTETWTVEVGADGREQRTLSRRTVHLARGCM